MGNRHASGNGKLADVRVDADAGPSMDEARGASRRSGAAAWLHLAATPTFAIMALASAIAPATGMDMICPPAHAPAVLGSMTAMYLLMAAFHAAPWVELVAGLRRRDRQSPAGRNAPA